MDNYYSYKKQKKKSNFKKKLFYFVFGLLIFNFFIANFQIANFIQYTLFELFAIVIVTTISFGIAIKKSRNFEKTSTYNSRLSEQLDEQDFKDIEHGESGEYGESEFAQTEFFQPVIDSEYTHKKNQKIFWNICDSNTNNSYNTNNTNNTNKTNNNIINNFQNKSNNELLLTNKKFQGTSPYRSPLEPIVKTKILPTINTEKNVSTTKVDLCKYPSVDTVTIKYNIAENDFEIIEKIEIPAQIQSTLTLVPHYQETSQESNQETNQETFNYNFFEVADDKELTDKELTNNELPQDSKPLNKCKIIELPIKNTPITILKEPEHFIDYQIPSIEILNKGDVDFNITKQDTHFNDDQTAQKLLETLESFGVGAKIVHISRGPSITRYELAPDKGVKVSKIVNLSDDIALNLAAQSVRIEAPIPGKAAIGIEIPNKEVTNVILRDVLESDKFMNHPSMLAFAVGKDTTGTEIIADITKMPHLLIAGATGSGKSVCINTLITSILFKASPEQVKLIMIDPKVVELSIYNGIPHLLIPVVTDPAKAASALFWAVQEMNIRYKLFAEKGVRDLFGYNSLIKEDNSAPILPQIVIIIDELADLMMISPKDVEDYICRLAQMARAAGMHLVIATQRPSVDVITGIIKANIPSRISFAVSSQVDSRTILDMCGAEKLLGRGDMLFNPLGNSKPLRVQGAFISDKEVENLVNELKKSSSTMYDETIINKINSQHEASEKNEKENDDDPLLYNAIELILNFGQVSTSFLQRKLKVGYSRAARLIDQMESWGIVSPPDTSRTRQIIISKDEWKELRT